MHPARWFFAKHEEEPTTEVAIRRGLGRRPLSCWPATTRPTQQATYAITVNPLVNWIWFGLCGHGARHGIALLPERAFAFATAKFPPAPRRRSLLLIVLLLPAPARAQHVENAQPCRSSHARQLEKELQSEIICMCGTAGASGSASACAPWRRKCAAKWQPWSRRGRRVHPRVHTNECACGWMAQDRGQGQRTPRVG